MSSLKRENHKIYDYLLDGLHIVRPNQVWQVDITYIRTRKGFAYLTALIDIYSRYS
ncbi:putative transposase OrfB [Piscirickettsia salmonis]|nr:putative transposase OrfB [Piscirickettsia salmonis]QGP61399.1 putative transposase OrfB [Piscirickettsia salmonis]QGP66157.1 putative transposase OrfB [Piscirickettsia salmonis]